MVPVEDPLKQKALLLREGFSSEEIKGAYRAWNFIDGALQSEVSRSILKRCKSPREAFDHLENWYDLDNEVATQKLHDKFHYFTISPTATPLRHFMHQMTPTTKWLRRGWKSLTPSCTRVLFARCLSMAISRRDAAGNEEPQSGRDHPYGRHAVLHPAPEEGVAAVVPTARASVLFERKGRPEWYATRSWPRWQGHPGPWSQREQQ